MEAAVVGQERCDRLAAEGVERLPLRARLQQPVLVGLAVDGDQRLGHLGQPGDRHRGAAHERTGPALGRDVAGQQHVVALDLAAGLVDGRGDVGQVAHPQRALDPGGPAARPDRPAVGAAAEQQPERGHHHRLAGAGLAGDHGQPGPELQGGRLDHAEAGDPQLLKHRSHRAGGARPRPASPRPAGRTSPPAGR